MPIPTALSGLPLEALKGALSPLPAFRAKQIFKWIARGATSFDQMSDLSQDLRKKLSETFTVYETTISDTLKDPDGTTKLQILSPDGSRVEAVLLVDLEGRKTACLSTQVGCPMNCAFCKTGSLGFKRNLTSSEIVEQFLHLRAAGGDISNIVVMGMGEPMLNLSALRDAISVFTDEAGMGLSRRRITVSTSGISSGIRDLADNGPDVRLAVSLTTADPALRARLMPVTRTDNLRDLKEALLYHQEKQGKRITLEAVLIGGVNTRKEDQEAMAAFAKGLDVIVNLIPWNQVEGLGLDGEAFRTPSNSELSRFVRYLDTRGIPVSRRMHRGREISGACGQLGVVDTGDQNDCED